MKLIGKCSLPAMALGLCLTPQKGFCNDITIALHELPGFIYSDLFLYGANGEVENPLLQGNTSDDEVIPTGDAEIHSYHADFDVTYVVVSITDPNTGDEFELKNHDFGTGLVTTRSGFVVIPDSGDEIVPQYAANFGPPPPSGTQAMFVNGTNPSYPGLYIGTGINFQTGQVTGSYTGIGEFTSPITVCKFNATYTFEGLNPGQVFGQDGWQVQAGASPNGAFVDTIGSPLNGGSRSMKLSAMSPAPSVRVWRNIGCTVNSGHQNFGYDFVMESLHGANSLLRVRPEGANNDANHQVFQSGIFATTNLPETPVWFADQDGLGAGPYQGLYYAPSLQLQPGIWYRVEYDMDFDNATVDSITIYDISSGSKVPVANGDDLGSFNNDGNVFFKNVGCFTLGIDASNFTSPLDGGNIDNFGATPMARASGHITPLDFVGQTAIPVDIELRKPGTLEVVDWHRLDMDWNGYPYALYTIPATYDISVKASHWLRRTLPAERVHTGGSVNINFELTNGDVDGNNEVGIGDYAQLSSAYGSFAGDGNWNENADLNGDGGVDIGDYSILSENYGTMGDD